ncbi:hypothetical protein FB565_002962 [Actinoplanes lutulentus]|uniref:Uncharacterized protein n=1 Tax=Actinoplanes lutulentus TaxID=1287878 RepID=A0A327Z195_9ACTN|nr:hypothetical protein [Actinoplanes lutulentus]MBB2943249.1 hypothetical protein [Actinoplanes lutulentus]RAK28310.1 hypothetical protein B0I29_12078 [Actinoplanes lutulentus]
MTLTPAWTAPTPDEVPFHCRTCRRALHRHQAPSGAVTFLHPAEVRGGEVEHPARPAPVTEIPDPIIECDFCSGPNASWVYVCADQESDVRIVTRRTVNLGDYQRRHHAARTRAVETAPGPVQIWGERWSACDGCAELIENRDLYGLIARVTDAMPAKLTRGKRLMSVRGHLHGTFSTVLDTLQPGRFQITQHHPLGVWQEPQQGSGRETDR